MPQHMIGYSEVLAGATPLGAITALEDETMTIEGDDVQVTDLNKVLAVAGHGLALTQLRLNSPSLRAMYPFYVTPFEIGTDFGNPQKVVDLRATPLELVTEEDLNAELETSGASRPVVGLVMGDASPAPASGKIFTLRARGTKTLTPYIWDNVPITFDVDLPAGDYDVVGLRAISATAELARLVFKGESFRPGVLASNSEEVLENPMFRNGQMGVIGSFKHNVRPSIEVMARAADTAEIFYLDLIKK